MKDLPESCNDMLTPKEQRRVVISAFLKAGKSGIPSEIVRYMERELEVLEREEREERRLKEAARAGKAEN